MRLFGLHASFVLVSKSGTTLFTGLASVAPVRVETSTRNFLTSEISQHTVKQSPASRSNARLRRDFLTTQTHSSGLLASDSHPPHPGLSSTLSIAASAMQSSYNSVIKRRDMRIVTSSLLLTSQHSLVLVTLVHTLSGFLLRFLGVSLSLSQILGALRALLLIDFSSITLFLCASLGPWCSPLLLATSHPSQSRAVKILLRSHGLSIPPKGTTPEIVRSGTLRLMSRRPWPS